MPEFDIDFLLQSDPGEHLQMLAALLRNHKITEKAYTLLVKEIRESQSQLSPNGREVVTNSLELYIEGLDTKKRYGPIR